jgi:hypothetical protein
LVKRLLDRLEGVVQEDAAPLFLYLDEFHSFPTLMLANMTSELRKCGVGLVLAHQYFQQLDPDMRHAALVNADTHSSLAGHPLGPTDIIPG